MSNKLHSYWQPLDVLFNENANPVVAEGAKKYLRNQFEFYGVAAPVRRKILANFLVSNKIPESNALSEIVRSAWEHPRREMHYAAMEFLFKAKKQFEPQSIQLLHYMITHQSWWDTVDYIAPNLLHHYLKSFPDRKLSIISEWMASDELWLQRSCLIYQLKARQNTDAELLFSLIRQLAGHKDFFIRKAIGWALRTYARTNPTEVLQFVDAVELSGLSKREALKHLQK